MIQEIMQFVSRNTFVSLTWVVLFVAVIVMTFRGLLSKTKVIVRSQAITMINKEDAVVVDLRSREEFRKGHIIDSINLTPSEIKDNNLGELEKHKQKPVIVVSASGMESGKPAEHLAQHGFEKVFVLKEGIAGWAGENLPLARGKK
ncbi:thiosulfate sulfurtransferase [Providencia rustigianii]|uniref:Rhodanese-like protein n=1 Tax=Providencia rustigianii DSM 4541 TaxID=500637 RepID=D1P7I6_9GAMM|nr:MULTISPECIES: rhodanese-like domain-containing protein [Providencia]EFB70726.1 rhodanese-like protein [Providencia rustigianii DSM 4541]MTC55693.1 rhodanese-like domain-containing protein [Providencia rustigianii]MTC59514.1 rhodanese-like domain-containing protein [Providencia rustigianii]SPY79343.1 thiosulfate sulfurtransferase [Providencia rustigianii]SUC29060.1 thiosulfate sulfurtransferase [Providencia rustigianii]